LSRLARLQQHRLDMLAEREREDIKVRRVERERVDIQRYVAVRAQRT
jgi:hypothetical protein